MSRRVRASMWLRIAATRDQAAALSMHVDGLKLLGRESAWAARLETPSTGAWAAWMAVVHKPIGKDSLANRLAYVDKHLSNHPYLLGEKFMLADAYLFTMLKSAKFLSLDMTRFPNLRKFTARVGERPKVKDALRAEGLS